MSSTHTTAAVRTNRRVLLLLVTALLALLAGLLVPAIHATRSGADNIDPPDLVICDVSRIEPEEVADAYPDVPILGFTNHTDTAGLRRAHTAGFDQVIAKSAIDDRAIVLETYPVRVEDGEVRVAL